MDIYNTVQALAWPPLVAVSRRAIISVLSRIRDGQLVLTDALNNTITVCGALQPRGAPDASYPKKLVNGDNGLHHEAPQAELRILRDAFWVRMLLFADMGFAESYMLGEVMCEDLVAFFEIFIRNRDALSNATTLFSSLASSTSSAVSALVRRTNTLAISRLNVAAHYDISNAMFSAFLSPDMTYSCPIFQPRSSPAAASETLEQAQMTKLHYIMDQARVKPQDHVLEIGTGWGSFAIEAVKRTGCRVTSLTLSREQKALAERRIGEAGLSDRISVLLCDYRALPIPRPGAEYDKLVSIEMLEAVGAEFLEIYFRCVSRLLKPRTGIAVFQCITIPEARHAVYAQSTDFIRRYIFPGGHLPTVTQLVRQLEQGSQGTLVVDDIRNIGGHYARTLRLWRAAFHRNFDAQIRPALLQEHHDMDDAAIDLFQRKWEYYFTYCEAGFRTKTLGDVIITAGREGATEMLEDIPL